MKPRIILLAERQRPLALKASAAIDGQICEGSRPIESIQASFKAGHPTIVIASSGIVIRALAPLINDKHREPPVIVLSENAAFAIPLLGGHRGANDLALRLAERLDAVAAVTTASDGAFGIALDQPPAGFVAAGNRTHKEIAKALLDGDALKPLTAVPDWLRRSNLPFAENGGITLAATYHHMKADLVYHPACLALGIGCERGIDRAYLIEFVEQQLKEHRLAARSIAGVFSIELKEDEPAIHALADHLGVPARFFSAPELDVFRQKLLTPSAQVFQEVGVYGVAEAAALATGGELVLPKIKGARATMAVACSDRPIDAEQIGRRRGRLDVVGLGPGDAKWRTAVGKRAIEQCELAVGYSLYLDLAGIEANDSRRAAYPLGAEIDRCRFALEQAALGRRTALICSGDPAIYAMASLVMELVEQEPAWQRLDIQVHPGISAMQLLSARAGAVLGHDFCAISLSDLLTPSDAIARRLKAAAEADFVVALYNPISNKRRQAFDMAKRTLLEHRPASTPVIIGRNVGRPGETLRLTSLGEVDAGHIDMLTTVLIGNSQSRRFDLKCGRSLVFTPRGYAAKGEF